MAFYLTPNTKFKPFSYQEMLAPVLAYKEAYDKADAELNALYEDAATKAFNFAPQDTAEKAKYDVMMDKLKSASDALASGDKQAFNTIKDINKEYRKTMIPIQQQMAKRAELAEEQRKLLAANPNLRFTKDYSQESLQNITSGSSYNIIDLDNLYKTVATEFGAKTAKMYRDDFDPTPIGNTGYYNVKSGYGYTADEFKDAFFGNDGSPKIDSDIYKFYKSKEDAIKNRTDISNDIKTEMIDAVYRGMEASAGQFTTKQIAGKTVTHSKLSDVELQKALDAAPKNSDFILNGDMYHKDDTGRTYKVGTSPINGRNSGDKVSKPSNAIRIKIKNGSVRKTEIVDPELIKDLGLITTYDDLDEYQIAEADKHIKDYGSNNFDYYIDGYYLTIIPRDMTNTGTQKVSNVDIGG